jgi:DNA-binding response OmpR family regulator
MAFDCDILLVDDDLRILRELSTLLEQDGHRVRTVLGGAAGLTEMRRKAPRLLLLDLHMPDVSGAEVLRAMQAEPRMADVPVIVVTAMTAGWPEESTVKAVVEKTGDVGLLLRLVRPYCGC